MIAARCEGEQYAGAEEVVDTEEENHANRGYQRGDEIEGPDSRKASPCGHIDDRDDQNDDAAVKDRTQREIGQKRQRADEAALRLSTKFKRNKARRAQGAGQTTAHRRPVPGPGVEGRGQEGRDCARHVEAKDRNCDIRLPWQLRDPQRLIVRSGTKGRRVAPGNRPAAGSLRRSGRLRVASRP
jgi:hypothetical protein